MSKNGKLYVIAALVVIIAVIGVNRTLLANPSRSLWPGGLRLGCCTGGAGGALEEEAPRSFGRGCCSDTAAGGAGPLSAEELRDIGLKFYGDNSPEAGPGEVEAKVIDFGCHQEIHIYQGRELMMKVGYSYGRAYEIP